MLLSDLKEGQVATILQVSCDDSLKQRLYDLGFLPGHAIGCLLEGPFHSPILYLVNGAMIALRKRDAMLIEVDYEA